MNIDLFDLKTAALNQKWKVDRTAKRHWRFIPPDPTKPIVIAAGTPSCRFAIKHIIGELKRSGLKFPT